MIKLDVCEYCQDCLNFEPEVTQRPDGLRFFSDGRSQFISDTVVQCEHRYKCEILYSHLKRENKNAKN